MLTTTTPATDCPISGYPRVTTTRTWDAWVITATYLDGSDPVVDVLPEGTDEGKAAKRVEFVWSVAGRLLATLELTFEAQVEVETSIHPDFRENYAQRFAAGEFDAALDAAA